LEEYAIVVDRLTKKFGSLIAVNNISFKVRRGEILAFLGPNGAGKTTTINMLITLLKPTSGKAYVAGYDVTKEPEKVRKKIGVVFQDSTLDTNLTAYENLYIHAGIYGYRGYRLKEKIMELLKFVELENFKDKLVRNFSGGMMRRLEIARSLIHRPEILFLDEPTLGLDPQTRTHIWDYIVKLRDKYDMTVFLTTHYMEEAENLADRIVIIDHGKIIADGDLDKLKEMVGKDVIYVRFDKEIDQIEWDFASYCKKLSDGRIEIGTEDASRAIPKIFKEASKRGLNILEISYYKPTLNDVFIHLTGREIRDERSTNSNMRRKR